eukprot:6595583-Lingulodinium_polyedra.AAC.1
MPPVKLQDTVQPIRRLCHLLYAYASEHRVLGNALVVARARAGYACNGTCCPASYGPATEHRAPQHRSLSPTNRPANQYATSTPVPAFPPNAQRVLPNHAPGI